MIDLICPKCQTKLPVAESKIGTRIFVCPKCAHPLEAPGTPSAPPAPIETSEDKTVAPDESQAYVQEKLRQIAANRAAKASAPPQAPPLAQPVPPVKKAGLPMAVLVGGGLGAFAIAIVSVAVLAYLLMPGPGKAPDEPGRDGLARDGHVKRVGDSPETIKPVSVDALAKAVKEGSAEARMKALKELGERGPEARPALGTLLFVMKDADAPMWTAAQETIARIGPPTKADAPLYAAALREESPALRVFAVGQLAELGQQAKSELLFLRVLALDDNAAVKEAAGKAVLRIEDDLLAA